MEKNNIVLIGMPGAGKSTVGVVLAKRKGLGFMDSDLLLQEKHNKLLQELIEEYGVEGFWKLEEEVNASLMVQNTVIATGGSAVYRERAMRHLKEIGSVVYLKLSCVAIEERLGDLNERGVTLREGQTLRDLFWERTPLYEKYADIIIDCEGKNIREIVAETDASIV